MKKKISFLLSPVALFMATMLQAQNTSPYWSLAGNSNAAATSKLGTTNLIPLRLFTNNAERLRIQTNGTVGIGTINPQQRLHLDGSGTQLIVVSTSSLGTTSGGGISTYAKALPTASGQRLGYYLLGSRGGAENNYQQAGMLAAAGGAWSGTSRPAYLTFETTAPNTTARAERMRIAANGNVGIGTNNPAYKIHVVGNALVSAGLVVGSGGINSTNTAGNGVEGTGNTTSGSGVRGSGYYGVYGFGGVYGVVGNGSNYGMYATSNHTGVYGSGTTYGLRGFSSGGWGVWGQSSSNLGVYGSSGSNYGVYGSSSSYPAIYGTSTSYYGVEAHSTNTWGAAAYGVSGVYAQGSTGYGIYGTSTSGLGGYFYSGSSYGIRAATGRADKNWAGVFDGNVYTFGAYQTSDKNLKKNIEEVTDALSIINRLRPRRYEFRSEGKLASMHLPGGQHYGFIAQDIEEVLPNIVKEVDALLPGEGHRSDLPKPTPGLAPGAEEPVVNAAKNGTVPLAEESKATTEKLTIKSVNYIELIPLLVKGMQEQSAENRWLKEQLSLQQQQIAELQQAIAQLNRGGTGGAVLSSAWLEQNAPNPSGGSTAIRYAVPEGSGRAQLLVRDALGRTVKSVQLASSGVVNLDLASLSAGVYTYSLVVDGKTVQTRKMTIER